MDEAEDSTLEKQPGDFRHVLEMVGSTPEGFLDAIANLAPIHQQCLKMRWGFDGGIVRSLKDVANAFELDERIIRKLELRIIRTMRKAGTTKFF